LTTKKSKYDDNTEEISTTYSEFSNVEAI